MDLGRDGRTQQGETRSIKYHIDLLHGIDPLDDMMIIFVTRKQDNTRYPGAARAIGSLGERTTH